MPQVVSVLLGIVTSFAAWFLVARLLKPGIAIRTEILKLVVGDVTSYRVMIRNTRRWRACVNVRVTVRLGVRALSSDDPSWTMGNLPVDDAVIPFLSPAANYRSLHQRSKRFYPQQPVLLLDTLPARFGAAVKAESSNLLEDLLALGEQTTLSLFVEGEDSFSGSRGYWVHEFDAEDIVAVAVVDRYGTYATDDRRASFSRMRDRDAARYRSDALTVEPLQSLPSVSHDDAERASSDG